MSKVYEQLREHVFSLEIVDTHEHLSDREDRRDFQRDVLGEYTAHYFGSDLVSAGLTPEQRAAAADVGVPLAKRWKMVEPYWDAARNTGYGRALDIAARELYGIERIDGKTIAALNEAFCAARQAGKTYETVLKAKSNIRVSILDGIDHCPLDADKRFFRPVLRLDDFVMAANQGSLRALAAQAGMKAIRRLADLEEACERVLDDALARGAIALKTGLAYLRPLRFERVTAAEAEAEFNELFSDRNYMCMEGEWRGATGKLQDHMMHHVCRLADERGLIFQVHTGLQEGNGNYIHHSEPSQLVNLFLAYPNIKFACFHISYPYQQTLSALAKNFRNVFIDFAWMHIMSPSAAVAALVEFLDAVPANKICGFGGDYLFVDGVCGHQHIARENIARALAIKVEQGVFDLDRARQVAGMLLWDNPVAIFNLAKSLPAASRRKR